MTETFLLIGDCIKINSIKILKNYFQIFDDR